MRVAVGGGIMVDAGILMGGYIGMRERSSNSLLFLNFLSFQKGQGGPFTVFILCLRTANL